jgi:mono/diheme cytochrome c family protein
MSVHDKMSMDTLNYGAATVRERAITAGASCRPRSLTVAALMLCLTVLCLTGCQQQMASQPSYRPLEASSFFADGQASRSLVSGTVARGHLELDWHFYTGRIPGSNQKAEAARTDKPLPVGQNVGANKADFDRGRFVDTFPEPVTRDTLKHGYDRYMIYCVVCHDPLGTGRGKIVERGYVRPPSYHIPRLRTAPVGRLFAVATEGYGAMPSYEGQIPTRDRWAIVAFIRALQLSQHFPEGQLTPEMRNEMAQTQAAKEGR